MKKSLKQNETNRTKQLSNEALKKVTGGGLRGPDEPGIITEIIPITTQDC